MILQLNIWEKICYKELFCNKKGIISFAEIMKLYAKKIGTFIQDDEIQRNKKKQIDNFKISYKDCEMCIMHQFIPSTEEEREELGSLLVGKTMLLGRWHEITLAGETTKPILCYADSSEVSDFKSLTGLRG